MRLTQLDSLRAFAVIAVIWHHWAPGYNSWLPLATGVQLFFVLSGFLITDILIEARAEGVKHQIPVYKILGIFYMRRALRIFPLYYAVLAWALILNIGGIQETYPWYFGHASNYLFIKQGEWSGLLSHFWTLAVEEQFYLFWPCIVLLVPARRLPAVLLALICAGISYRAIISVAWPQFPFLEFASPGSFDSLALGGLLACRRHALLPASMMISPKQAQVTGLLFVCAYFCVRKTPFLSAHIGFISLTLISVGYAALVMNCSNASRKGILGSPVLIYLGTISYGLYILHNFALIPAVAFGRAFPSVREIPHAFLIVCSIWTLGTAILSWQLLEKPFNNLKRFFVIRPTREKINGNHDVLPFKPKAATPETPRSL